MLDRLIKHMQLVKRQAEEKVTLDQILIHVERTSAVLTRRLELLHLDVAQSSIRKVSRIVGILDLQVNGN